MYHKGRMNEVPDETRTDSWRLLLVLLAKHYTIIAFLRNNLPTVKRFQVFMLYIDLVIKIITVQIQTKHFLIKMYLSFYFRKRPIVCCWLRDRWKDIYSERGLLLPIYSSGSQRVPTVAPPVQARQRRTDRLRVPRSTAILSTLSKSDRVVLITWSPSGYTSVLPECPDAAIIFLLTNQNVTGLPKHTGSLGTNRKSWSNVI